MRDLSVVLASLTREKPYTYPELYRAVAAIRSECFAELPSDLCVDDLLIAARQRNWLKPVTGTTDIIVNISKPSLCQSN